MDEKKAFRVPTPLGDLLVEDVSRKDTADVRVTLVKPDGTRGTVAWVTVQEDPDEGGPELLTLAFDGDRPDYAASVRCDPDGGTMDFKQ